MIPFAIAGVQMHVGVLHDNTPAMVQKVDLVMASFPWVQMILFSELAACGPLPNAPQAVPSMHEQALAAAAARYGQIWLLMFSGPTYSLHMAASPPRIRAFCSGFSLAASPPKGSAR